MKTIKIVPSVCKGDDAKWSGYLVMRLPTFDEKFEYIESLNMDESGDVESESKKNMVGKIRSLVSASKKHYEEISLENIETKEKITSFDEMQYEEDLHGLMAEIAGHLARGFKVGNG